MKKRSKVIFAAILAACSLYPAPRALLAANPIQTPPPPVPLRWKVETSRAQVAQFEAYRGEALLLEAEMRSYGKPFSEVLQPSLYWQTNGMGAAWWTAPATASGNVLRATWSPTNDCGGTVYNCFIGGPDATYRAAFRLRMLPSPGYTPNHLPLPTVTGESDPVFSSWLATNKFSSARAETVGTDSQWTDATGTVWQVAQKIIGDLYFAADREFENKTGPIGFSDYIYVVQEGTGFDLWLDDYGEVQGYPMSQLAGHDGWWKVDRSYGAYFFTPSYVLVTNVVGRVAYTNDIPDVSGYATPEDVSAAADSAVATANAYTDGQTTPLWSYLGAESFRVVVTNYDSAVHPPVASFEYRMTTNEAFRTVWAETNGLNRAIATATNLAHQAARQLVNDPANRAWGKYDSETGEASPEGVIQATAPGGLIVGGGQRWSQISAESGWWILTSTDPTLCRTGTNGVFSIIGSDGQEAIRVVKGSKVTVPAPADGISVSSGVCTVTYAVEAERHPTARFASELGSGAGTVWYNEDDADCPVTMTWSGTSGNYVLTFDTAGLSSGFVQATYEQGQESYTSFGGAGLELTKIRIGGKVYTVGTSTIDGKTVLTLE